MFKNSFILICFTGLTLNIFAADIVCQGKRFMANYQATLSPSLSQNKDKLAVTVSRKNKLNGRALVVYTGSVSKAHGHNENGNVYRIYQDDKNDDNSCKFGVEIGENGHGEMCINNKRVKNISCAGLTEENFN
ncbi:MAG: hypothetical protein WCG27_06710 [Pseudomonadota bacterium]